MLTKEEILYRLLKENSGLSIEPHPIKIGPNSADLTLDPRLLIYGTEGHRLYYSNDRLFTFKEDGVEYFSPLQPPKPLVLDVKKKNPTQSLIIPDTGLILFPGKLYLGCTIEYTETKEFIPQIETVSSVARLGLMAHLTAGYGDTGFRGVWVLELVAHEPIRVYPNMRIAQIYYTPANGKVEDYGSSGKYQGQTEPVASNSWKDYL